MPRATLTSRALNNKDTGLDLFVPTYKESKGLVLNNVHYQVVLVSSLSCFKAPSHKEADVVQYSIEKKFGDFEELRNKISESFSASTPPPINKKSIIVNDAVLKERRNSLDNFVKFLASSRKLSTCQPLLEFLGVDLIRAKKFSRGESLDQNQTSSKATNSIEEEEKTPDLDVFGEEEEEESLTEDQLFKDEAEMEKAGEESIFDSSGIAVFDGQDLKRELTEDDEADFSFVPDGIVSKKVTTADNTETNETKNRNQEDHSDLFEFNDDLDQLMNLKISKKSKEPAAPDEGSASPSQVKPPKPSTAQKPAIPGKPGKPSIASKPAAPPKPVIGAKPSLPQKPDMAVTSQKDVSSSQKVKESSVETSVKKEPDFVDALGQDDILKYLQAQSESTSDDLDLFS